MSKASEEYQDSQVLMDQQGSRASLETQVVKASQDPQASWDHEGPKAPEASLALMGF